MTEREPDRRLKIRPLRDDERGWLAGRIATEWGSQRVVSRGRVRDASELEALLCLDGDEPAGAATYEIRDGECEVVTLHAFRRGGGAGSRLLASVAEVAAASGCRRLWLITTNDNVEALRFYQRRGMRLVAVHAGSMDEARRHQKPEIPLVGNHGIPIRDEIELELDLRS